MAKDTFYFSHDYNARTDDKIKSLIRKHGMNGYGVFWSIVEDLYNNENTLRTDYDGIAFDLRTENSIVKSIVNDFDLFVIDGDFFGSESIEKRLTERNGKSEKARQSAVKRWSTIKENANALRTHCDGNAIKERKGKEIKDKKVKESNEIDFDLVLSTFNEICVDFPKVKSMNDSRKDKIKIRLLEMKKTGVEFIQVLYKTQASDFLKGINTKGWKASFDWLIENEKNWLKVIEGNYDNRELIQKNELSLIEQNRIKSTEAINQLINEQNERVNHGSHRDS